MKVFRFTLILMAFMLLASSIFCAEVKFCAVGDILFDRGIRTRIEEHGINYLFEKVKPIISAHDLALCNLECPLTPKNIGYPLLKRFCFRGDPESIAGLTYAGFNIATMANNHTMDWGRDGLTETLRILQENNIQAIGAGANQSTAATPVIIRKNGLTFAFISTLGFLLEGIVYNENKCGPAYTDINTLTELIKETKKQVDFVIVTLHWGIEKQTKPATRQVRYAHQMIDAGADLIIGHHPHVLQTIEKYKDRFILYSLGNFVFDSTKPEQQRTAIFSCIFDKGKIKEPIIIPVRMKDCQPGLAEGKDLEIFSAWAIDSSKEFIMAKSTFSQAIHLATNYPEEIVTVPIKEWNLPGVRITVFSSRMEIRFPEDETARVLPFKESAGVVKDACLVRDKGYAYVYAIVGDILEPRGKQIAIFPIDLQKKTFKIPSLDAHNYYNPWKIRAGDVDGDGEQDLIVGVWKATKYFPQIENHIFVYNRFDDYIYPKWLGSKLGPSFSDFEILNVNNDAKDDLVTYASGQNNEKGPLAFTWDGFGFKEIKYTVCPSLFSGKDLKVDRVAE
ncbi:MAG: CapA family protein [Elusimicrobia bacterium]|nr:CapA family protein [Elusimicrobiota bacterium]